MSQHKEPVPPRNWKKWAIAYIAHGLTGAMSGAGVGFAVGIGDPVYALTFLVSVLVCTRQTLEYLRRNDTPGRDLGDHLTGFALTLALTTLAITMEVF